MLTLAELDEALRGSFAQGLAVQHVEQDVQSLLRIVDDFDLLRLQAIGRLVIAQTSRSVRGIETYRSSLPQF